MPITIRTDIIEAVQRHAGQSTGDQELLMQIEAACPTASLREIARAALYAATDPAPADPDLAVRLFHFGMSLRQAA
jgi:hypothetical protein